MRILLVAAWSPLGTDELGGGVVFVLFDEGDSRIGGGGHIAPYAVGPAVRPGAKTTQKLSHYNVLVTIEDAWGLPRLGNSAGAAPITGISRRGK